MSQEIGDDVPRAWGDVEGELERRLETAGDLPTLEFYRDFADEWQSYPSEVRLEIVDFLERLQHDPYDHDLLERCDTHDRYYAFKLDACGAVVYWSLKFEGDLVTISELPKRIRVLAIEFDI
jgi:hypothetical protein